MACLETQTGDLVWLTVPQGPLEGFALVQEAQRCMAGGKPSQGGAQGPYTEVVFPMVHLDREEDISYFCDMVFLGMDKAGEKTPFLIGQALNQNKLKMNHLGARAESAAAFSVKRCMSRASRLVIDQPFMVWFTRDGLDLPYFAAFVTPDDWKNPGDL